MRSNAMDSVYEMPGHLIRRAHQLSTAIFAEECAEFDLTPVQYAALEAIEVGIFRTGSKVLAYENVCPHAGGPLCDAAIEGGMLTLRMDGWLKVLKGVVPLEQVLVFARVGHRAEAAPPQVQT